jgi:hypothetical protein
VMRTDRVIHHSRTEDCEMADSFEHMLLALDAGLRLSLALRGLPSQCLTADVRPSPTREGQIAEAFAELGRTLDGLAPFFGDLPGWQQEAAAVLRHVHDHYRPPAGEDGPAALGLLGCVMYAWMDHGEVGALALDIRAVWPQRPEAPLTSTR